MVLTRSSLRCILQRSKCTLGSSNSCESHDPGLFVVGIEINTAMFALMGFEDIARMLCLFMVDDHDDARQIHDDH